MKVTTKILLLSAAMLCVVFTTSAQEKHATIGIGFGGASVNSKSSNDNKSSGFGFNFYLNGMYNVNENISAGLEYNTSLAVVTDIDLASLDVSVTKLTGILAKGRYKFGSGNAKPFAGLMAGLYLIKPGEITISGSSIGFVFEGKTTFGFAPEIGVELGSFQFATSYHFPGKYSSELIDPTDGSSIPIETTYTSWQFNIGWNIGVGDK